MPHSWQYRVQLKFNLWCPTANTLGTVWWMLIFTHSHTHTHTHTTILRLSGYCLGQPGWAGIRRYIHPLTPILVVICPLSASSICYDPWHPPCSLHVPESLFPQSPTKFILVYLGLAPSTSYSMHFFTQSLSLLMYLHETWWVANGEIKTDIIILIKHYK